MDDVVARLVFDKEKDLGPVQAVVGLSLGQVIEGPSKFQEIASFGLAIDDGCVVGGDGGRHSERYLCIKSAFRYPENGDEAYRSLGVIAKGERPQPNYLRSRCWYLH